MRLSAERIRRLKQLLEDELGLKYKDEDLELIAIAVVRFVYLKEVRKSHSLIKSKGKRNHD